MTEIARPISDARYSAIPAQLAEDMWCPEVRRLYADEDGSGAGINRRSANGKEMEPVRVSHCIGPKCMAWRWVALSDAEAEAAAKENPDFFEFSGRALGYCGKAGSR